MDSISGLPFWEAVFDAQGDQDAGARQVLLKEVAAGGLRNLFVFAHGWNNDQQVARRLYNGFFGLLAAQLPATARGTTGLAGVLWPAKRWSDEPIPDFTPTSGVPATRGTASAVPIEPDGFSQGQADPVSPALDAQTLADLRETFPQARDLLDELAALLAAPPADTGATDRAQAEFLDLLKRFSDAVGTPDADPDVEGTTGARPGMLDLGHRELFETFRDALQESGMRFPGGSGSGQAGATDSLRGIWNGAKEALRQATYWEMKNRAGVVGRQGLGPFLTDLHQAAPQLRVHLIGHSFGARLAANTLAGLPAEPAQPVASVTLLQGAFSHFAFVDALPFDTSRKGALAGLQRRIDGPLTVCFSRYDSAVGTLYPLASAAARQDSAAAQDRLYRWGGMGHDGAQNPDAKLDTIQPVGPDATYRQSSDCILNIDAADVVKKGGPPSGAHSDIIHPELTWVVLKAAGLV